MVSGEGDLFWFGVIFWKDLKGGFSIIVSPWAQITSFNLSLLIKTTIDIMDI